MTYKYYSYLRPIMPGAVPRDGLQEVHNFDDKILVKGQRGVWGYAVYNRELTETEKCEYELLDAELVENLKEKLRSCKR